MATLEQLEAAYVAVKYRCGEDWKSAAARNAIRDLALLAHRFLVSGATQVNLVSLVANKTYFSYERNGIVARPANTQFFLTNTEQVR